MAIVRVPSPAYVVELARKMRKDGTLSERLLWGKVRGRKLGGFRFKRQDPFGRYILDFDSLEGEVVVEVDGSSHADRKAYDAVRDEWLQSLGFRIVRVSATDVETRMEHVLERILGACLKAK